jgi:hypothetical protein
MIDRPELFAVCIATASAIGYDAKAWQILLRQRNSITAVATSAAGSTSAALAAAATSATSATSSARASNSATAAVRSSLVTARTTGAARAACSTIVFTAGAAFTWNSASPSSLALAVFAGLAVFAIPAKIVLVSLGLSFVEHFLIELHHPSDERVGERET